jgi:hypothetical protein
VDIVSFSWGWLLVVLGFIHIGDGIQQYARQRQGKSRTGALTPLSAFLLGLDMALLGILTVAVWGMIPFWLYLGPILLTGASFVRLQSENQRATSTPTPQPGAGHTALTAWERAWKGVSTALNAVVLVASLIVIGTLLGTGTAILLLVVILVIWLYLHHYKRKHGYPLGGR